MGLGQHCADIRPPAKTGQFVGWKSSENQTRWGTPSTLALPPSVTSFLLRRPSLPMKLLLTLLAAASAQVKYGWRDQHVRIHPQLRAKIMEKGRQLKEQNKGCRWHLLVSRTLFSCCAAHPSAARAILFFY